MNILLCSERFKNNDIEGNSNKIIDILMKPYDSNIEFVFFGEAYLNGFDALSWNYEADVLMKDVTNKYVVLIKEKAKQFNIGVGFGYYEFENNKIYSSFIIFDNKGTKIYNYRRVSRGWRIKEANQDIYSEGKRIGSFNYNGFHFGVVICGDVWHKELYEEVLKLKLDVLVWPVYVNYSASEWSVVEKTQYLEKSKALAKHVLYINSLSDEQAYGGTYYQCNGSLVEETIPSHYPISLMLKIEE